VAHKQRATGVAPLPLSCQGDGVVMFDLSSTATDGR
jgi:hypothetical protein